MRETGGPPAFVAKSAVFGCAVGRAFDGHWSKWAGLRTVLARPAAVCTIVALAFAFHIDEQRTS